MNYKVKEVTFQFNGIKKNILIDKILYIESRLHRLEFHVMEKEVETFTMYEKLDNIEDELSRYDTFVRVHQSYLVNLKHIRKVKNYSILLSNNEEIPVPKSRFNAVKTAYIRYKGEV